MKGIKALAITTYREAIRSKALYSVFFFMLILLFLASFFGSATVGDRLKVIKDFGLTSLSLFSVIYIIIIGTSLLHKELEQKTVFVVLARPISRSEFILGKFLGLVLTLTSLIILMSAILSLFVYVFEGSLDVQLFRAYYHIYLQSFMVCGLCIFFSAMVVTPVLSGAFSLAVFIAGRSSEYLLEFAKQSGETLLSWLIKKIYYILPQLDKLDISDLLVNNIAISQAQSCWASIYALFFTAILISLACVFFKRREFK